MKLILENWNEFLNEQNFDTATGAPISDKGRELCAKNPQCKAKHMSDAAPAQSGEAASDAAHKQKMAAIKQSGAEQLSAQEKQNAQRLAMMAKQIAQLKDNPNMTPAEIILGQFGGDVSKMPPKVRKGYETLAALDKRRTAEE